MKPTQPAPANFPRLTVAIFYDDPRAAIDWLQRAFGFEARLVVEDGGVVHHSELLFGDDALIMVAHAGGRDAGRNAWARSPRKVGGCTQSTCLYVDDVEAHYLRAARAGADIVSVPADSDHGPGYWVDRSYACTDVEGHHWWFSQRLRDNPPA
jgi:uncharacterized glyoxalase superfamily protein PhnB